MNLATKFFSLLKSTYSDDNVFIAKSFIDKNQYSCSLEILKY